MDISTRRKYLYRSIYAALLAPVLLLVPALFGIHIPYFAMWLPIYAIAFVPYIVIELIFTIFGILEYTQMQLAITIVLQTVFAHLVSYTAVYGNLHREIIGTFSTVKPTSKLAMIHKGVALYLLLFLFHTIYFLFTIFMA